MHRSSHRRTAAVFGTAVLAATLIATASPATASVGSRTKPAACSAPDPADCGQLFDDFSYRGPKDPAITRHGWYLRTDQGGPGQSGATWTPDNITFTKVDGQRALQLTTATDGTAAGTTQAEFGRTDTDALAGTYVARIKFADRPVSGPDGDHVVQTFYAISAADVCSPTYSETDFSEYLPNGGYGEARTFDSESTWALAGGDTCDSDFVESDQYESLAGWHTVMATVAGGTVTYFIDGAVVGTATGKYYPRATMSMAFNEWTLDLEGHTSTARSTWKESVDYVFYAENRALTPKQAAERIAAYRHHHLAFFDTVGHAR